MIDQKTYSYKSERRYYAKTWPRNAKPFQHLDAYMRCWTDPEVLFTGKRVLDIGAGECTYTRLIAGRYQPTEVVACELFYERMLPAFRDNRNERLKFIAGDTFQLPFRDDSFHVVFGSLVLSQLPDLNLIAAEINRVLLPGGCYVGIEPNPYHPVHLYRFLRGAHSPNQYLLSERHLAAFREVGFEVGCHYFYAKLPMIHNRLFGTCMGIIARHRKN
ncbi:MAG: class I SAM-dependent methyltransferase [Nitrospirota bacterium]